VVSFWVSIIFKALSPAIAYAEGFSHFAFRDRGTDGRSPVKIYYTNNRRLCALLVSHIVFLQNASKHIFKK
jgi:hypothetical protein